MDDQRLKTGTTTVGIVCKDGIVLAADKKATMGYMISTKDVQKVVILNNYLALTIAGTVSDAQLLTRLIKAQIRLDELRNGKPLKVKEAANMLASLVYNNIRKMSLIQGITAFLFAGKDAQGHYLFEIGMDGSLIEFKNFTVTGSGSEFALGAMENEYKENLSLEEGVKLIQKAVNAAIQRDIASGGGIDIITITKEGTKHRETKRIDDRLKI